MKALIYSAPERLDYCDTEAPEPGDGEQLIRVVRAGICGSDMHAFLGHDERRPAPLILGHEVAGVIEGGSRHGERVCLNPLVTCGLCDACQSDRENLCATRQIISMPPRAGAFAELISMPESNLVSVPDGVSLAHAALTEPLSCGWHAVRRALEAHPTAPTQLNALVIGGGSIGLGSALALRAQGVAQITLAEANPMRREGLQAQPDIRVLPPDALPQHASFDVIIDGVGLAVTRQCASVQAKPGGVIAHIGLGENTGGLDIRRMTLQEISFIGTYTFTRADFCATAQAIFDGRLGALDWAETRPLSAGAQAFVDIQHERVAAPKILLAPEGTSALDV